MIEFLKENFMLVCLIVGLAGVLIGVISLFHEIRKRRK